MLKIFVILMIFCSCSPSDHISPWQTKVDAASSHLNSKNIGDILARDPIDPWVVRVALVADPQGQPDHLLRLVEIINARNDVDFVMVLGDLTNEGLSYEYELAVSALKNLSVPVVNVAGNHDVIGHGRKLFKSFFGDLNKSFKWEGIQFILADTNKWESPGTVPDKKWILSEIAAAKKEDLDIGVFTHVPFIKDQFSGEEAEAWQSVFIRNSVDGVFSGHRHSYVNYTESSSTLFVIAPKVQRGWGMVEIDKLGQWGYRSCHEECGSPVVAVKVSDVDL